MPIFYKPVERKNPAKPLDPAKFYASASAVKRTDLKELAQSISDKSTTVSHIDVHAVLLALTDEIAARIPAGETIHLGDLGYFFFLLGFLHNQKLPGLQRQRAWRKAGGIQNEVDVFLRDASLHIKLSASVAFVDYFFHGHGCMRSWMHGCGSFAVGLGCALDASLHCERCGA